jgi:hypothetical protein
MLLPFLYFCGQAAVISSLRHIFDNHFLSVIKIDNNISPGNIQGLPEIFIPAAQGREMRQDVFYA